MNEYPECQKVKEKECELPKKVVGTAFGANSVWGGEIAIGGERKATVEAEVTRKKFERRSSPVVAKVYFPKGKLSPE